MLGHVLPLHVLPLHSANSMHSLGCCDTRIPYHIQYDGYFQSHNTETGIMIHCHMLDIQGMAILKTLVCPGLGFEPRPCSRHPQ